MATLYNKASVCLSLASKYQEANKEDLFPNVVINDYYSNEPRTLRASATQYARNSADYTIDVMNIHKPNEVRELTDNELKGMILSDILNIQVDKIVKKTVKLYKDKYNIDNSDDNYRFSNTLNYYKCDDFLMIMKSIELQ
ncbi:hypothetical protein [Aliivibrio fischeri]|uniref:hypothetical protein n=1 Tax=Aliivibrio fischeri TaxID=668 RepID=UPI0012DA3F63|nr:hypothetical protein [Aliivibrio fischeri]MUL16871.1 hypothetical protein [Aliivibrio fischeri]